GCGTPRCRQPSISGPQPPGQNPHLPCSVVGFLGGSGTSRRTHHPPSGANTPRAVAGSSVGGGPAGSLAGRSCSSTGRSVSPGGPSAASSRGRGRGPGRGCRLGSAVEPRRAVARRHHIPFVPARGRATVLSNSRPRLRLTPFRLLGPTQTSTAPPYRVGSPHRSPARAVSHRPERSRCPAGGAVGRRGAVGNAAGADQRR